VPGYEILGELGRGGMGVVYQARQLRPERLVALKMILAGGHAGEADLARFRAEAEAVARLQHPNVVQVYEVGEHDGRPFFSLELCGGGSLADRLRGGPLAPREAAALVETLARAVHAAHRQQIVHRDLKPGNVLLTADGTPKITDFGLARRLDAAGQTQTGSILGTPSYMAPEQAGAARGAVGPAADVYALGAVLYECLTGRPPFQAATPMDTVLQVLGDDPVPPSRLNSRLPRDLETVCLKCLQKEPKKRYASAEALAEDLRRFLAGEPILARPTGRVERAVKWARRRPAAAALVAVSLLAALALLGGGMWFTARLADERDAAERAREKAQRAQHNAEVAEEAKDEQLRLAEARGYALQLGLARRELQAHDPARALQVLDDCRPGLRHFEHRYLAALARRRMLALPEATAVATGVAFHPDGRRVAAGSWDRTVRVWDAVGGKFLLSLPPHADRVLAVAFSPDGRLLASGSGNLSQPGKPGEVQVWEAATGKALFGTAGHKGGVTGLAFSPDGKRLASAGMDGAVKVWDSAGGKELLSVSRPEKDVGGLAFSPDGKRLAATAGAAVKVWDAATGKETLTLAAPGVSFLTGLAFHPGGGRLAGGGSDGAARVWDLSRGQAVLTLRGRPGEAVWGVAFRPDGKRLATCSNDGLVREWDADTGQELRTFRGHSNMVLGVAYSPDGRRLASAGGNRFNPGGPGEVRVWDLDEGPPERTFKQIWAVHTVAFSPDGKWLASGGLGAPVTLRDVSTGEVVASLPVRASFVHGLAFRPGGQHLAAACGSFDKRGGSAPGEVVVWDLTTRKELYALKGHKGQVYAVAYSPDGKRLASASDDRTVKVWDAATAKELRSLAGHKDRVTAVLFHPDGRRLVSASWDGTVRIWDADTGKGLQVLTGHPGALWGVACSPDGKHLAGASHDHTVKVWDVETGRELRTLAGHPLPVRCVAFSPDGRRLVSGVGDAFHAGQVMGIKVWGADTGQELLTLEGHTQEVNALGFSPDGQRLASGSSDGAVKLWEAAPPPKTAR
jgi:WD40 repeat protein